VAAPNGRSIPVQIVQPAPVARLCARQNRDLVLALEQPRRQGATDEATAASHQNASHIPVLIRFDRRGGLLRLGAEAFRIYDGFMLKTSTLALAAATAIFALSGCASTPAAPFDQLKTANLTAYRLQNYEVPRPCQGRPPAAPGASFRAYRGGSDLDPARSRRSLAADPAGLLPGGAAAVLPAADTTPRFHDFRILSQTQVLDPDLKESLGKLLGDKGSFDNADARCAPNVFYAEMGLSFSSTVGQAPNDLLVSFSCNQVVSRSFAWPHRQPA